MSKNNVRQENKDKKTTGIKAVLEQSLQSYDRLPMLEVIFEKFVRKLSTALRNLTSEDINISILEYSSLRFSNYFNELTGNYSISIFKAIEWENFGLVILENKIIYSCVNLLLGGKKTNIDTPNHNEERILTSIEQGIAKQVTEVILSELSQSFDQVTPTSFSFERLENSPNFVNISRPEDAVIVLKLNIELDEQTSIMDIMIPYKTIEPIKEQMQQIFLGDKFGISREWDSVLNSSILGVELPIEAILTDKTSSIKEISNLKVGDIIIMEHHKDKDIIVRAGPVQLFTGKIGKVGNNVAVNLNKFMR